MSTSNNIGPEVIECSEKFQHKHEWPPGREWKLKHDGQKTYSVKICATDFIGKGGFGEVFKGHRTYLRDGKRVDCRPECFAIKVLKYKGKDAEESSRTSNNNHSKRTHSNSVIKASNNRIARECEVHVRLNGENAVVRPILVLPYADNINRKEAILCMEYCPGGDLGKYLEKNKLEFTDALAKIVTIQVVSGLKALKNIGYFHRDVKASNIFVTSNGKNDQFNCKLGDLGFVAKIDQDNNEECGTRTAMAPEMDGRNPYDEQVDIWSLGIMLFTLKLGQNPFGLEGNTNTVERRHLSSQPLKFPSNVRGAWKDLIQKMLCVNPSRRIRLEKIDQLPFFKQEHQYDSAFGSDTSRQTNTTTTTGGYPKIRAPLAPERGFTPYQSQFNQPSHVYR